ncbi:cell division protein ZapA [Leptolyngbya sp. 15MV]|nr:cell division protein ZapA [Leptolyngbya sp. 15MV]
MSEVTLSIGSRRYTVACAAGEEAHVARLGAAVDAKLVEMGDNLAPQEAQNLLFAALLIADDLHQARKGGGAGAGENGELERLRTALASAGEERDALAAERDELRAMLRDAPPPDGATPDPGLAPALERFAELLENCADKLEGKAQAA